MSKGTAFAALAVALAVVLGAPIVASAQYERGAQPPPVEEKDAGLPLLGDRAAQQGAMPGPPFDVCAGAVEIACDEQETFDNSAASTDPSGPPFTVLDP